MSISRRAITMQLAVLAGTASALGVASSHTLIATPRQTEGPFYPPKPHGESDVDLTLLEGHSERAAGVVILVRGRATNLAGNPLRDARVDIWQANHHGRYAHPADDNTAPLDRNFQGIGTMHTDPEGYYGFKTIRPAPYRLTPDQASASRARHIHFKVTHGGAGDLTTQMYFAGDPLIENDIVMRDTPAPLRHLLITSPVADPETGLPLHRFDVVLA